MKLRLPKYAPCLHEPTSCQQIITTSAGGGVHSDEGINNMPAAPLSILQTAFKKFRWDMPQKKKQRRRVQAA
jgi:hypothetical protein